MKRDMKASTIRTLKYMNIRKELQKYQPILPYFFSGGFRKLLNSELLNLNETGN